MIKKELHIESPAIHQIIHEELRIKKLVCRWVLHDLTKKQKAECTETAKKV